MELRRRTFLGEMLAAGALPALAADNPRIARVGLVTDTHVKKTMASCATVRAALELFKAQGAEMVINCGDIADQHFPDGYRCYRRTVNEVYPDVAARPKEVFVYAFHDVFNYKPGNGGNIARDAEPAFADVHAFLEAPNLHTCDFVWRGLPFAVFPQSTSMKGFLSWEDYEKTVARLCAEHPGKPVFVLEHVPAAGTTFHSRHWGSDASRRVLNKFPQVVQLSGHVHGSLASERQIWQGEFTAVNLGCLNTWGGFAPGSTPPHQAKENYGVLVLDVYRDRLVFTRYDVRDRSQPGDPWVVPLPFAAQEAPFRPSAHAQRCPKAAFAAGAAAAVNPVEKGYAISFPEAREGGDAFMYRLEAQRKSADGAWQTFSRDDIFGDFWKAAKDRTGSMAYTLSAGFFNPGEAYRISVTPLDFFYRPTAPVFAVFTASHAAGKSVWKCADPRAELAFTEWGKPVARSAGGRFAPSSGQGTLRLPEHAFKPLAPGARARVVLDLDAEQPDGEWCAWRAALRARGGGPNLAEVQTAPGAPGVLRYVFDFTVPAAGLDTCDILFNYVSPRSSLDAVGVDLQSV